MPKYEIRSTEPTTDGTGMINYDVWALDDNDLVIPGKHITIQCPYDEVQAVLNKPTGPQKLAELKAMLLRNRPTEGWDNDALSEVVAANLNAAEVDENFDDVIVQAGGYPYAFSL